MAYSSEQGTGRINVHIPDRAYFIGAAILFAIVIFGLVFITSKLMGSDWTTYDMQRFQAMAEVIASGATPYLDYQDPKPPLIFFTLAVPTVLGYPLLGGLLFVGICNLASALLLMAMAWKLYGRFSGFLAGLLFTLNITWAQGYFVITEPFALTFILLATYILMFTDGRWKYLAAGICAGLGIGFKQYALLLILPMLIYLFMKKELRRAPALQLIDLLMKKELRRALELLRLYILYVLSKKELRRAPELLAGILIPLAIMFGAIFAHYGVDAGLASLHWSFGIADTYMTQDNMGDVSSYRASTTLLAAANIVMAVAMFTSLLLFAAANVVRDRPLGRCDVYFILAALLFAGTLLIRAYLHYWILALPFIALLCARQFRDKTTSRPE